jgi:hypothetical protein
MNLQEGALHVHEVDGSLVGRTKVGETGHTDHIPCVVATQRTPTMSRLKRVARIAAGAILATGLFAGAAAPAGAVSDHGKKPDHSIVMDTGWGG